MLERIARTVCAANPDVIVEIGPGKGALTEHLLRCGAVVHAIEIDPVMLETLRQRFTSNERLIIHHRDVLDMDLAQFGPCDLAGNLPYYITSPILERIFAARGTVRTATLLVQKEVAARLVAGPRSRDYGYLSVVTQSWAIAEILCNVPPEAFRPPPKVDSAVVHLRLRTDAPEDTGTFLRFAGQAFRQKRKTLRNNLQHLYPGAAWEAVPERSLRAEQLTIPELRTLWERLGGVS